MAGAEITALGCSVVKTNILLKNRRALRSGFCFKDYYTALR